MSISLLTILPLLRRMSYVIKDKVYPNDLAKRNGMVIVEISQVLVGWGAELDCSLLRSWLMTAYQWHQRTQGDTIAGEGITGLFESEALLKTN